MHSVTVSVTPVVSFVGCVPPATFIGLSRGVHNVNSLFFPSTLYQAFCLRPSHPNVSKSSLRNVPGFCYLGALDPKIPLTEKLSTAFRFGPNPDFHRLVDSGFFHGVVKYSGSSGHFVPRVGSIVSPPFSLTPAPVTNIGIAPFYLAHVKPVIGFLSSIFASGTLLSIVGVAAAPPPSTSGGYGSASEPSAYRNFLDNLFRPSGSGASSAASAVGSASSAAVAETIGFWQWFTGFMGRFSESVVARLSGSPRFCVRYLWLVLWRMFAGTIAFMYNNPITTLIVVFGGYSYANYHYSKRMKALSTYHIHSLLVLFTFPAIIGAILGGFDFVFSASKGLAIAFLNAAGIPVPDTLLVATGSTVAGLGTYFLRFTPAGLLIGGRIHRMLFRRSKPLLVLMAPSHGVSTLVAAYPGTFVDLADIIPSGIDGLRGLSPVQAQKKVDYAVSVFCSSNTPRVFLSSFGNPSSNFEVIASCCFSCPSLLQNTDLRTLELHRQLLPRFQELGFKQFDSYKDLHEHVQVVGNKALGA